MAINDYDKIRFSARIPKYHNTDNGQITVTVSGTIAPSTAAVFFNTWSGTLLPGSLRGHVQQSTVPVDGFTRYTNTARLPISCLDGSFDPRQGCSVAGSPSVASIEAVVTVQRTSSGVAATITIFNGFAGTMTLTNTTYTFKFWVYTPTYALS